MFSFSLSSVHSNPPASWVLISKKSYIDILQTPEHKSTTPMFTPSLPTSPLPGRADSQESEESGHTGSTSNSYFSTLSQMTKNSQIHTTEPNKSGGAEWMKRQSTGNNRLSYSDTSGLACFPPKDEDSQDSTTSGESGVVSTMLNYLNLSSFFRGNSPSDDRTFESLSSKQRTHFLSPQEEYKPSPKKKLTMSHSYTFGARGGHSKTPSWHGHTEWEKEQMIQSIRLPITLSPVHLRVQEYNLDKLKAVWDIHEYNDIFVHPSTLPELYQASNGGKDSYLVLLSTPDLFNKVRVIDTKAVDSTVPSSVPTPTSKQSTSQLPERPKKDDHNMLNVINRLSNYEHLTPPAITVSSPTPPDNPVTTTVACHLQFATTVRFNNKRKKSSSTTLEEIASVSREGSSSPTLGNSPYRQLRVTGYLPVLPNHVLMSDLIRQQLGVRAGSCVRLSGCRENWRVNCRQNRVSLYLYPVNRKVLQIHYNLIRNSSSIAC